MVKSNNQNSLGPRLEIHQAMWAMIGLGGNGKEWSLEERFEKIAEGGFDGILDLLPPLELREKYRRLLDEYGVRSLAS
jgi:sugar phosphate isomerase/epimerase